MGRTKPKPYAGGKWTLAKMRSFVTSALRRAQWPCKYEAIRKAFVKSGINPKTGRMCKLYECSQCGNLFPQKDVSVDHVDPVVPIKGFNDKNSFLDYDWNNYIRRLFVEVDGLSVLCKPCHRAKTLDEKAQRAAAKKNLTQ